MIFINNEMKKIQTVYCIDIGDDSHDDLIVTSCSW